MLTCGPRCTSEGQGMIHTHARARARAEARVKEARRGPHPAKHQLGIYNLQMPVSDNPEWRSNQSSRPLRRQLPRLSACLCARGKAGLPCAALCTCSHIF